MASFDIDDINIRPLKEEECEQIRQMIMDLAEFEKMADRCKTTAESLKQDIFGQPTRCSVLVAEDVKNTAQGLVGFTLYFPAYSTWERTFLHLEDLYVKPDYRQKGIGKKLYQAVVQVGLDMGCPRVELEVLDWNTKAKNLYEKFGNIDTTKKDGWRKMRMGREAMEKFVKM